MPDEPDPDDPDLPDEPDPGGPDIPVEPPQAINDSSISSSVGMRLVNLSWTAPAGAASYEVYYSLDSDFANATKLAEEPAEPAVTVLHLPQDDRAYNFWVVAKNAAGKAAASNMHTSDKISEPVPAYLTDKAVPGGPAIGFMASNLWSDTWNGGYGDIYRFQDLGPNYPAHERYPFSYGGVGSGGDDLYPGGVLKFVRDGTLIYEFERIEEGVPVKKYQATYYSEAHLTGTKTDYQGYPSHPPAAVMGQANGYSSGMGNAQETYTLEEAIAKYAHSGDGTPGSGGRTDYWTPMRIFYGYNPQIH